MTEKLIQCLRCSAKIWLKESRKIRLMAMDESNTGLSIDVFLCPDCYNEVSSKGTTYTANSIIKGTSVLVKTTCLNCGKDIKPNKTHECNKKNR